MNRWLAFTSMAALGAAALLQPASAPARAQTPGSRVLSSGLLTLTVRETSGGQAASSSVRRGRERAHPHPRAAPLPEGPFVPAALPTPEQAPAGRGDNAPPQIIRNARVPSVPDGAPTEPYVAANEDVALYVGNTFGAVSTDSGEHYTALNPQAIFGKDEFGKEVCCDQYVLYVPTIDRFIWLLQYDETKDGKNVLRVAYASTSTVRESGGKEWQYVDIPSGYGLGVPRHCIDFPDLAATPKYLYVTGNLFLPSEEGLDNDRAGGEGSLTTSVVARIPLAAIASGQAQETLEYRVLQSLASQLRLEQNSGSVMHMAGRISTSQITVHAAPDGAPLADITAEVVSVPTTTESNHNSRGKDRTNWLGPKWDAGILGCTRSGNTLWMAWNAGRGGASRRPQPYVAVVGADLNTSQVVSAPDIWSSRDSYAYPALATNADGVLGVTLGMQPRRGVPNHMVGVLRGSRWALATALQGTNGPSGNRWGDYLGIQPLYPDAKAFAAAGYANIGGKKPDKVVTDCVIFQP